MAKDYLTDEQVEIEIERLRNSEACKLGLAEKQYKNKRRQTMYTLRWYEKRGLQLMKQGISIEDFKGCEQEGE